MAYLGPTKFQYYDKGSYFSSLGDLAASTRAVSPKTDIGGNKNTILKLLKWRIHEMQESQKLIQEKF